MTITAGGAPDGPSGSRGGTQVLPDAEKKEQDDQLKKGGLGSYSREQSPLIEDVGNIFRFAGSIIRHLPSTFKYPTEILRQAGILLISSSMIILFMEFLIAAEIAIEAHYVLGQLGAQSYVGLFNAICDTSCGTGVMWGWVVGAKVGCGFVAELGAMRNGDEIDALEVMGIDSMGYLVGTRLMAIILITPFLYTVAVGVMYMANYLVNIPLFHSVSEGGFWRIHWSFVEPSRLFGGLIQTYIIGTLIVVAATYYGYTARGGAVGVGRNTAKSMIVSLMITGVFGVVGQLVFFTGLEGPPIGN